MKNIISKLFRFEKLELFATIQQNLRELNTSYYGKFYNSNSQKGSKSYLFMDVLLKGHE